MRRPRNDDVGNVSDEIEAQRKDVFDSTAQDFRAAVEQLKHTITTASSIKQMLAVLRDFEKPADELVTEPAALHQAIQDEDVDGVRRQLLMGLDRWSEESLKWSEVDGYDTSTLSGHPMRPAAAGGVSFKRPNGP